MGKMCCAISGGILAQSFGLIGDRRLRADKLSLLSLFSSLSSFPPQKPSSDESPPDVRERAVPHGALLHGRRVQGLLAGRAQAGPSPFGDEKVFGEAPEGVSQH